MAPAANAFPAGELLIFNATRGHNMKLRVIAGMMLIVLSSALVHAQDQGQKVYATPKEKAGKALHDAVKSGDKSRIEAVLGPSSSKIVSSGDKVQDQNHRNRFVMSYEQMNRWVKGKSGDEMLIVGAENWPFPIPMKKTGDSWHFDATPGAGEILFRRIGRNELATRRVCYALADAQKPILRS